MDPVSRLSSPDAASAEPSDPRARDPLRRLSLIALFATLAALVQLGLPLSELSAGADPTRVRAGLAILVFAGGLWLTEALPLAITALSIPVLASLTGTLDVGPAFAHFAHPLIFLFLAGFGLAAALSRQGLDAWLAYQVLHLTGGHFRRASFGLFGISAALSMWVSNTATVALLLPVALGLIGRIEQSAGTTLARQTTPYLLLGIAYSASIGGIGTLVGSPPNAIAAGALGVSFAGWLALGLPMVAVLLPTLFVALPLLARPGVIPRITFESIEFELDRKRRLTLALFATTLAAWLASGPLSAALGIGPGLDSVIGISAVIAAAALGLVEWKDIDRTTDWGVLLLFGGGLTLSRVLDASGAGAYLAERLSEGTSGLPILALLGFVVLFIIFLTEISSNTATAALFVPIGLALAGQLELPAEQLVVPIAVACSCAFMLPVATPPNAIVFGSGRIEQRTMMRIGLALNLCFAALITGLSLLLF